MQRLWQLADPRLVEVMTDKDLDRLVPRQPLHIGCGDLPVSGQVDPETLHRVNGDAIFGRPAGIVGIVHIAAFAADNFICNRAHIQHADPHFE